MSATQSRKSFFGEEYLLFSEAILTPERTQAEISSITSLWGIPEGSHILDLGCGQGRLTIPLAERSYNITALDDSKPLLEEAMQRAEKKGVLDLVRFIHADMKMLNEVSQYDAVINIGTAFGYDDSDEQDINVLQRIERALKPNGIFIQETENRDFKLRGSLGISNHHMNGTIVTSEREFDCITGRWREKLTWKDQGQLVSRLLDIRLYTPTELIAMTHQAGLQVQGVYGSLEGIPLGLDSSRLVIVSRKRG